MSTDKITRSVKDKYKSLSPHNCHAELVSASHQQTRGSRNGPAPYYDTGFGMTEGEAQDCDFNKLYLSKAVSAARKLSRIGNILLVGVSGSLARGKAKGTSDIDFFVISKSGRIFTIRFLSKIMLGKSARRNCDKNPAGKICLNYFLSEDSLDFKPHSEYVSKDYRNAIILFARGDVLERLAEANKRINPKFDIHKCHSDPPTGGEESRDKTGGSFISFRMTVFIANLIESVLKYLQVRKIKKDPMTQKYPQKIVFSDLELRFHPPKGED